MRIETAGGTLKFNPYFHILETEGCYSPYDPEDGYYTSFYIPYRVLRIRWMHVVLNLLVNFKKMSSAEATRLRNKYRKGFNVNSQIRDHIGDPLECPQCASDMRIKEIVTRNVEQILKRLRIHKWYYREDEEVKVISRRGP